MYLEEGKKGKGPNEKAMDLHREKKLMMNLNIGAKTKWVLSM